MNLSSARVFVRDLEEAAQFYGEHQQLLSQGVHFCGEPEQQYWGGWLDTFLDPAGNEMQLVQSPA